MLSFERVDQLAQYYLRTVSVKNERVDTAAEARSISSITLRRAKERLNVRSYKEKGLRGRFMCALREYEQDDQ
jgi:hypothetical protein